MSSKIKPRHKVDRLNTIRRMKLEEIKKIVQNIPVKPDTQYLEFWEAMADRAESELANKIRNVLSKLPTGFNENEPTIKTQAKNRFVAWREQQAKGEWKTLSEEEQQRWISYVENQTDFGTIRQEELSRLT
jgi:uncharacterized protein YabN with tetrapyrrole methylase and pyrophosphatase domain